jgi:hypothetical protein
LRGDIAGRMDTMQLEEAARERKLAGLVQNSREGRTTLTDDGGDKGKVTEITAKIMGVGEATVRRESARRKRARRTSYKTRERPVQIVRS